VSAIAPENGICEGENAIWYIKIFNPQTFAKSMQKIKRIRPMLPTRITEKSLKTDNESGALNNSRFIRPYQNWFIAFNSTENRKQNFPPKNGNGQLLMIRSCNGLSQI
jgi:hypothetical protein